MNQILNHNEDKSFINDVLSSELTIYEDIQGTKIFINWDGEHFTFKQSNINNNPINLIDVALQKFYNPVIDYLYSLDTRVKALLNKKWWFGFEYFPDNQPANIEYSKVPKNNLILTCIYKTNKFDYSDDELFEYSNLLGVDPLPIVFKGKLSQTQIEGINYFLNTSKKDLEYIFDEANFCYFFYRLLNPSSENSFLMDKNGFNDNIQKLIIKTDKHKNSFQLLNPLYQRLSDTNSTEFVEIYSLILINFLDFCQIIDLNKVNIKTTKRDEMYLELICRLYNTYINDVKSDILNFNFVIPKFFNKEKFRINTEVIPNKLTRELIEEDPRLEYTFKVILGSLKAKKKKNIGLFTDSTTILFNKFVDQISNHIDKKLKYHSDNELRNSGLVNFNDFIEIKYDVDADNKVYPDLISEIEDSEDSSKSKKGKETTTKKEEVNDKPEI